jgi:hypothetical protein
VSWLLAHPLLPTPTVHTRSFTAHSPPSQVSWLLANSIGYERTQFKLLCEQNLAAVWRKRAYRNLLAGWEHLLPHSNRGGLQNLLFGTDARRTDRSEELKPSIVVFREGVDFSVENTVPQVFDYVQKLTQRVADTHELCEGDEQQMAVSRIMKLVVDADFGADPRAKRRAAALGAASNKARVLFAYEAVRDGDLALSEGDVLTITSRGEDGWWAGELKGKRGRFPGSYVAEEGGGGAAPAADTGAAGGVWVEPGEGDELGLSTEQVQEQEQECASPLAAATPLLDAHAPPTTCSWLTCVLGTHDDCVRFRVRTCSLVCLQAGARGGAAEGAAG